MSHLGCSCEACCGAGLSDHLLDRLDAGDRLLGIGKTQRNRSGQLAVDVNGAAAHALQDADLLEGAAAESRQDNGLLWGDVWEHAEDLDLELFDAVPLENRSPDAVHPRTNIPEGEELLSLAVDEARMDETEINHRRDDQVPKMYFVARSGAGSGTRSGNGLTHVSDCLSKLVKASLCD